jgi:hypothetical protein
LKKEGDIDDRERARIKDNDSKSEITL